MTKNSRKPRAQIHQVRTIRRELTATEKARLEKARAEVEAEKDEYIARARKYQAEDEAAEAAVEAAAAASGPLGLPDVFRLLRAERERQGLSLADVQDRTGIVKSQICTLETAVESNPTVNTICRVAEALGMGVEVRLVRKPEAGLKS